MKRQFLLIPSLLLAAVVLFAALSYGLAYGWLIGFARQFYGSTDHVLYPFLAARVVGYRSFLWILLGILALWCAALWADPHSKRFEASVSRPLPVSLPWIVRGAIFLALAAIALLLSNREWVRFGQPCWDNYCLYSELVSTWLQHPSSETWAQLHSFMRSDYHCNSPVVPLLVACSNLVSGMGVVASYRLLSAAATALGLFSLFWFIRHRLAVSIGNAAAIILLSVSNIAVIRSSYFPQTDAFIFLWITLSITQSWVFMERPTLFRAVVCSLILTTGLFIKLSFLPALAIIPLWTGLEGRLFRKGFSRAAVLKIMRRSLVFVAVPLMAYFFFQVALDLTSLYAREFGRMTTDDSFPPFHVISLLQVGAVLLPLIALGARKMTKTDSYILVWSAVYVLSLWAGRTSGWDRFYLAIIPPLAIVSRHGVGVVKDRLSAITVSIGISLYAFANYCALLLNLYQ